MTIVEAFEDIANPENYVELPDNWYVGIADIAGSTSAMEAGLYKTINIIGAAVISAQINVIKDKKFPFIFGGDGSTFAISPNYKKQSLEQLAAVRRWAQDEFGIELRTALIPVKDIHASGNIVAVARFAASAGVDYAMFRGGGIQWAEERLKAGEFDVQIAEPGITPDLTGLSCRWQTMQSQHGSIFSLVIVPVDQSQTVKFDRFARKLILIVEKMIREGRPVPDEGPGVGWPPEGLSLEAHASHGKRSLFLTKCKLLFETLLVWIMFKTKLK
ncbi:MAG: DUF3095 family protein, partial [Salaquimonas sp.]